MTNLCSVLSSYVLVALWVVPVLAATAWLAGRLAARISPLAEHRVWVTAYLLSLVLPAIPTAHHLLLACGLFSSRPASETGHSTIVTLLTSTGLPVTAPPFFVLASLTGLWLCSVLVFFLRLVWSLAATTRCLRQATPLSLPPETAKLWTACQRAFSLPRTRLLVSPGIAAPFTVSLPRPVLVLPYDLLELATIPQLQTALAHECAHIHRRDFRQHLLYELLGTLIAFHPATTLLKARIAASREMVCDALAIRILVPRPVYLKSLLHLAALVAANPSAAPSHAIGIFDANVLETRIMTLKAKPQPLDRPARVVVAALSILLLSSMATGVAAAALLFAPAVGNTPVDASATPVYKVGGDVKAPQLIYQKEPDFPPSAAKKLPASFKGDCILGLTIDRSGVPRNIHVIHSLRKDFDASAIDAVRQYRFSPALRATKPVAVAVTIDVNFQKF